MAGESGKADTKAKQPAKQTVHKRKRSRVVLRKDQLTSGKILLRRKKPQKEGKKPAKKTVDPERRKRHEDRIVRMYLEEKRILEGRKKKDLKNRELMKQRSEAAKQRKEKRKLAVENKKKKIEELRAKPKSKWAAKKSAEREELKKKIEEKKAKDKTTREEKRKKYIEKKKLYKEKLAKKAAEPKKESDKKKIPHSKKHVKNIRKKFPAQPRHKPVSKPKPKICKLRNSIKPGQVLIVLRGPHRGRRVVFLKQLPQSGLLMVSGPYCLNKVPLRRLDQRYVIATQTRVDISKLKLSPRFTDKYFRRPFKLRRLRRTMLQRFFRMKSFKRFAKRKSGYIAIRQHRKGAKFVLPRTVSKQKKIDQRKLDRKLMAAIQRVPYMKQYLSSRFGLKNGQYPHLMKF